MKKALFLPGLALFLFACNKKESITDTPLPSQPKTVNSLGSLARFSGPDYSQPISIALANEMIGSYLQSVNYPAQDTAIRSFAFDADSMRAYLADTSIKTIRFYMAHTPEYAAQHTGVYAGVKPNALTLIVAGFTAGDLLRKNTSNGVYEHMFPCPERCTGPVLFTQ